MMIGDSFTCPSCKIRYTIGAPIRLEHDGIGGPEHEIRSIPPNGIRALRNLAAEFDSISNGNCYTASEFIDYIEPSIRGTERHRVTLPITTLESGYPVGSRK